LVRAWDAKLKASGFRDIESRRRNGDCFIQGLDTVTFQRDDEDFWRAAHLYTEWNTWTSPRERQAWFHFAEGRSIRQIRTELRCDTNWLVDTLRRHREQMVANLGRLGEVLEDWWDEGADGLDASA
jgi:hypothetical protein